MANRVSGVDPPPWRLRCMSSFAHHIFNIFDIFFIFEILLWLLFIFDTFFTYSVSVTYSSQHFDLVNCLCLRLAVDIGARYVTKIIFLGETSSRTWHAVPMLYHTHGICPACLTQMSRQVSRPLSFTRIHGECDH